MKNLKEAICDIIDQNRDVIIDIGEEVLKNPELGYKELKTSKLVLDCFLKIGLIDLTQHAITGVKGWLRSSDPYATIAVMGELDAVICPAHPYADKETFAAHSCGHNTQIASMLGCAIGLKLSGAMETLCGDVCFFATPAEEYVELEYRKQLVNERKISYLGGKQQLIHEGAFDDIDMAMMVHSLTGYEEQRVIVNSPAMGFIGKSVAFHGKEAHAGGAPHEGINALNAASIAIMCINAQRETFKDYDGVRVHPIITKGGDLVNIVPADVRMESYVRANTIDAMQSANQKVNRAIEGASYAIGTTVDIDDMVGYLPLHQNTLMSDIFRENAHNMLGDQAVLSGLPFAGSTDVGDLGYIMPVIQPTMSGFHGGAHSKDFTIIDKELAYILPAKLMAMTVVDLLVDNAKKAKEVLDSFPKKTSQEYKVLWENIIK